MGSNVCAVYCVSLDSIILSSFFDTLPSMYAATTNDDDRISSSRLSCRYADRTFQTIKCFIITPSVQYINPKFSPLISRSDTFDDDNRPLNIGTHIFDIDLPPSPPLSHGSPSSLVSSISSEFFATRLFATPPGSVTDQPTSPNASLCSPSDSAVRLDSSLGALTKRFVDLLQAAPYQSLDLNDAVRHLGVQKRRIYDITNVLEGIGMIRKDGKNNVAWCGSLDVDFAKPQDEQLQRVHVMHDQRVHDLNNESKEIKDVRQELDQARSEEQKLEAYMRHLNAQVALFTQESRSQTLVPQPSMLPEGVHDPHAHMYISYSDMTNNPAYNDDNLIALRAPKGTNIEVPDPHQGGKQGDRSYQMYMTSQNRTDPSIQHVGGAQPIDVHLVRPLILPESVSGSRTKTSSGQERQQKEAIGTAKRSTPSPVRSSAEKKSQSTPPKQNAPPKSLVSAPPPFRDLSGVPHWAQGTPVTPWGTSPAHPSYGFYDFSGGMATRAHQLGHAYSPSQLFSNKRQRRDEAKGSPPDTPDRSSEAHGLMNSPLGDVLPHTPAGTRTDQQYAASPSYGTQHGSAGSVGSHSPLYELPPLASLPPIYSPHPPRLRFSPSPLDWRDPSPEKGSSEE
jgi:hypothetical protein